MDKTPYVRFTSSGDTMDWTTGVTAVVALYGAVLSTYTLIQNRKEKQRQVSVKLIGFYRDQLGTVHRSNTFALDIDAWTD